MLALQISMDTSLLKPISRLAQMLFALLTSDTSVFSEPMRISNNNQSELLNTYIYCSQYLGEDFEKLHSLTNVTCNLRFECAETKTKWSATDE